MMIRFAENLRKEIRNGLPGEQAQYRMSPMGRLPMAELLKNNAGYREGSVLILLFPSEEKIKTALIVRQDGGGVHSGQVAFPGGKKEPDDKTLYHTAIREAGEEVGLKPDEVCFIGKLTELFIPASNFLVHPFVGYSFKRPLFVPLLNEVKRVMEVNTDFLLNDEIVLSGTVETKNGFKIHTPYYAVEGEKIWGATAMIISELSELMRRAK